ncbi:MAG: uracil-DNA glycosylase [Clostridia bacterium]|nr:uracil-DNA glycosylase [Clostridia bacterium]
MQENKIRWEALEERVKNCRSCALCQTRTNTVFGRGNPEAKILFVGEAPGEQEDREGKPFVGPAGKLLDDYLTFLGLEEEDYYIANILKCRPPRNRDPEPGEEEACMPFLREQTQLISPRILVCLGRIAAQRIISPDFRITRDHGRWFEAGGMKIMATFHPSALLRDPAKKEAALDDFLSILKQISN